MVRSILLWFICVLTASVGFSSGFSIFEHGAKATGMAGSFTAQGDDPSALFYNPAGIAFQKRGLYLETTGIFPDFSFSGDAPYPGEGITEEMPSQKFLPSTLAYVHPLNDQWIFGVGIYNPFGLSTRWKDPELFTGRYISTLAAIRSFQLQPTVAFRPQANLAFALGIHYLGATVALERFIPAVNPYTQSVVNIGHTRMDGGMDGGFGFDLGFLYKFHPHWSIGISYHSETKIEFKGTAKIDQLLTGYDDFDALVTQSLPIGHWDAETEITFPAFASLGIATTAIPNWTFELDINFAGWSSFDALPLTFPEVPELNSLRVSRWEDTMNYRLGAQYQANDHLFWRWGVVFDENPQPTWDVSPILPDSDRWGYGVGMGYKMEKIMFDVGYMYLVFDDRSTKGQSQDSFNGTYESTSHLLGLALTYNF